MMKLIDRILKKIFRRYLSFIIKETDKLHKSNSQKLFNSINKVGKDSFFWGSKLTISDPSKIEIGQNVHIGNNAYIKSEGGLVIGDNTHISRNLVLYTINHNYNADVLPYNNEMIKKKVVIGQNVWIGMDVCIAPGTVIGDGCIIGMGTVVSGEVPPLSIIGSEKWKIIGERDEERYFEVLQKKRFGKENGLLYSSGDKTLREVGDSYTNNRTYVEVINFDKNLAIKKSWENNDVALQAYTNEKEKYLQFKEYPWLPKLYEIGQNYLIIEFIGNEFRLDQMNLSTKTSLEKNKVLGDIIVCLLDMFANNIAHCDIHSKNIFITPKGIKIIDFETAQTLHENTDFYDSYDITGQGLTSPYKTNNSCVLGTSKYSLKEIFQIKDENDLKQRFQDYLKEELFEISNTFFTRKNTTDGRHTLRNRNIYSTFDLKFFKVDNSIGQRDIKKRFEKFNVEKSEIEGKNILDIGSNIGSVLFEVIKMKPESALGVEYDINKVRISNTIKNLHFKNDNLKFKICDVESSTFLEEFEKKFEIVFCLAVIDHLKNKDAFINKLGELCTETLYFEGNSGTNVSYINEKLKKAGFSSIEYLGLSSDEKNASNNNRPLFRARK